MKAKTCEHGITPRGACVLCRRSYLRERQAAYRAAHPGLDAARAAAARKRDPLRQRAANVRHYERNAETMRTRAKVYRDANADAVKRYNAAYRSEHPEERRALVKAWRLTHPDRVREHNARRRARKRLALVESYSRQAIFQRDGGKCHICGKPVGQDYQLDHLIPLSRGGADAPWNVAVAHPRCNYQRGPGRIPAQLRLRFPEAQG